MGQLVLTLATDLLWCSLLVDYHGQPHSDEFTDELASYCRIDVNIMLLGTVLAIQKEFRLSWNQTIVSMCTRKQGDYRQGYLP